jgi:hypothetical protein
MPVCRSPSELQTPKRRSDRSATGNGRECHQLHHNFSRFAQVPVAMQDTVQRMLSRAIYLINTSLLEGPDVVKRAEH